MITKLKLYKKENYNDEEIRRSNYKEVGINYGRDVDVNDESQIEDQVIQEISNKVREGIFSDNLKITTYRGSNAKNIYTGYFDVHIDYEDESAFFHDEESGEDIAYDKETIDQEVANRIEERIYTFGMPAFDCFVYIEGSGNTSDITNESRRKYRKEDITKRRLSLNESKYNLKGLKDFLLHLDQNIEKEKNNYNQFESVQDRKYYIWSIFKTFVGNQERPISAHKYQGSNQVVIEFEGEITYDSSDDTGIEYMKEALRRTIALFISFEEQNREQEESRRKYRKEDITKSDIYRLFYSDESLFNEIQNFACDQAESGDPDYKVYQRIADFIKKVSPTEVTDEEAYEFAEYVINNECDYLPEQEESRRKYRKESNTLPSKKEAIASLKKLLKDVKSGKAFYSATKIEKMISELEKSK